MSELQSHLQGYIDKIDTIQITSKSNPEELIFNEENDNNKHFTQFDPEKQWFWVSVEYVKGLRGSREDCDAVQIQVKQNLKQAATIVQSLKQETTPASVGVGAPLESLISRLEALEKGLEKGINLGVFDRLVAEAEDGHE